MKIIIVGAGKVGYYLTKTMLMKGHYVSILDKNESRCKQIVEEFDVLAINGDGTDFHNLADAGADQVDVVAAVTGSDEENLIVCQMAKRKFSVEKTVARINNPKNERIFKELGVDVAISSTSLIAENIESQVLKDNVRTLLRFNREDLAIVEFAVEEGAQVIGKKIEQLAPELPEDMVFVSIFRENEVIYPRGGTELMEGDRIIIFTASRNQKQLKNILSKKKGLFFM